MDKAIIKKRKNKPLTTYTLLLKVYTKTIIDDDFFKGLEKFLNKKGLTSYVARIYDTDSSK